METVSRLSRIEVEGYNVGTPDGRAGKGTLAGVKRFQTDRDLPVTGKLDAATLTALGISASGADSLRDTVVLSDAVNALVETVDAETQRPVFLAATNLGLYRSFDPTAGWQSCLRSGLTQNHSISTDPRSRNIWWARSSGVLVSRDAKRCNSCGFLLNSGELIARNCADPLRLRGNQTTFICRMMAEQAGVVAVAIFRLGFHHILINPRNCDEVFVGNAIKPRIGGGVYRT